VGHVLQQGADGPAVQLQDAADDTASGDEIEAAKVQDVASLTNADLVHHLMTTCAWLADREPDGSADYDNYASTHRWLAEERTSRVQQGHIWLTDTGPAPANALLQFAPGPSGRTEIVAVDPAMAYGLSREPLDGPIITGDQFVQTVDTGAFVVADDVSRRDKDGSARAAASPWPTLPFAPPLLREEPMPLGTRLEEPVALKYFPESVAAPPNTAKFDLVSGGPAIYYFTTERKLRADVAASGPGKITFVNERRLGADVVSVKGPKVGKTIEEMDPAWVQGVVQLALNKWVNQRGNPRTSTGTGVDWRMFADAPQSLTVHIDVPEEALDRYPMLQQAAEAALAESGLSPPDTPPNTTVRMSRWQHTFPALGPVDSTATQGLIGGVLAVTTADRWLLLNAEDHPDLVRELAIETAEQAGVGVTAGVSQSLIEAAVRQGGVRFLGRGAAALLGRAGSAGFVGAGPEAYDLWNAATPVDEDEALARITRKAAIGVASNEAGYLAGSATVAYVALEVGWIGAAAGSWAPVVGTVLGFVVGLTAGVLVGLLLDALVPMTESAATDAGWPAQPARRLSRVPLDALTAMLVRRVEEPS
jgi:hypothetical protein